jgi:predicted  nucleic acid-binding Zn-ribbon protein
MRSNFSGGPGERSAPEKLTFSRYFIPEFILSLYPMALAQSQILSNSEVQTDEGQNPEVTELCAIKKENFRVILHKTYIKDLLYRVEATDGDENYHLDLGINHFNGQECKEYIQACPGLLEKLFKIGNNDISIKFGDMVCDLEGNIISAKIIIPKVVGTELEQMKKKISRQDAEISKLKEQIKIMSEDAQLIENIENKVDRLKYEENEERKNLKLEIGQIALNNNKLSKQMREMSDKIRNYEKKYEELDKKFQNLSNYMTIKHKNETCLTQAVKNVLGKWRHEPPHESYTWTLVSHENTFAVIQSHTGDKLWQVVNVNWNEGKLSWIMEKIYGGKDCSYQYDSQTDIITVTNLNRIYTRIHDVEISKSKELLERMSNIENKIDGINYEAKYEDLNKKFQELSNHVTNNCKDESLSRAIRNVFGKWIHKTYTMTLIPQGDTFVISRSHTGDIIWKISNLAWKGGKLCWIIEKFCNGENSENQYDPSTDILTEINPGPVHNIFTRVK